MRIDEWYDVPGYNGKYQANFDGQVRRVYKAKTKIISQYFKSNKTLVVKLIYDEVKVAQVIWNTFKGEIPKGYNVVHINGIKTDNCINNLKLISKHELGVKYGGNSRRKGVIKLDRYGNEVDYYRSARQAGIQNYTSYQTIADYCYGKQKNILSDNGFTYVWGDDTRGLQKRIRKLELLNGYMPKANNVVFDF